MKKKLQLKLSKVLTVEELQELNSGIKELVKEKTELNKVTIKKDFEDQMNKVITESQDEMVNAQATIIQEMVDVEVASKMNEETSKQLILIKENKRLAGIVKTLNKSVEDKDQDIKIQTNQIASLKSKTSEKEVVNESMMYMGVDISDVTGVHGTETTTMSQLSKNLSNENFESGIASMLSGIKNL